MSGFVYFIPGATGFADAANQIPHAIDPAAAATRGAPRGPQGQPGGAYFAGPEALVRGELEVEGLEWHKAPGASWWLGVRPGELPGPDDLRKPGVTLPGFDLTLGDGKAWRIPVLLLPKPGTRERGDSPLPKVRRMRDDGTIERAVAPAWRDLYVAGDEVWDLFAHGTPIEADREFAIAVQVLAAHYRVGPAEVSHLGLLTDEAMQAIYCALVVYTDWAPRAGGTA